MPDRFPHIIFFDLDGTLLAPGSILTPRTTKAVRAAAERGAEIVLSTGGFSYRALLLARRLDGDGAARTWVVTHNGGSVWDPAGRLVHCERMPGEAMAGLLRAVGPQVWCVYEAVHHTGPEEAREVGTAMYFSGRNRRDMAHFVWGPEPPETAPDATALLAGAPGTVVTRGTRRAAPQMVEGVLGCWCIGTPRALAPLDALAEEGAFAGARYLPWAHRLGLILGRPRLRLVGRDVGPLGTSKATAAEWLCRRLGVAPGESAAFGDSANDVELMEFAGHGVAMRNAIPQLLGMADEVAPPCTEDGVAQVLEQWLDVRDSN